MINIYAVTTLLGGTVATSIYMIAERLLGRRAASTAAVYLILLIDTVCLVEIALYHLHGGAA
jgi:hypothetical protein